MTRALLAILAGLATITAACGDDAVIVEVFAASSLTNAFSEIEQRYEEANPEVDIRLNLAGSDTLRRQIDDGANADVFAPAALEMFEGLGVEPVIYASNVMVMVATEEAVVQRVFDNDLDGLLVAQCAAGVPCGDIARTAIEQGPLDLSGATVSSEANVRAVLSKVVLGEADLGFVYVSDVVSVDPDIDTFAISIWIPDADDRETRPSASLGIAALTSDDDITAQHAAGFAAFVVDAANADVFERLGFDAGP